MKHLYIILILLNSSFLFAQSNFYATDSIREIRLYFTQANWDHILDSFHVAGQDERLLANIMIDGVAFDSIGVRYKGYSSVSTNRKKNPFNISLDYVKNQNYNGVEKIKLSNVIQDPSFLREVLAYEICRKYMPASQANYANVYVNDTLWGLYTSVEDVGKSFVDEYFGSKKNTFVKCNPTTVNLFGENSNLSDTPGTDSTSYYSLYSLESDYGWRDLYQLIDILNNSPSNIEQVLNVDRTLWMHAFNYSLINFDSYVGYAQNYYLYKDDNGQFNPIVWDLNMSFASYRLADASIHFSGFNIQEAKEMDPLLHHNNVSVYPRPLMRNLFANDRYRKMYMAHLKTIIEENFADQSYKTRALQLQNLIDNSVASDTNKFYSYAHFIANLNSTVTNLIDYPGITDLMDARVVYLSNYPGYHANPTISNINTTPANITLGAPFTFTAQATNADTMILAYRYGSSDLFTKVFMFDNGLNNDGAAGDGIWGATITAMGNEIQYYLYAENDSAGIFAPQRAAYEYYTILSPISAGQLVINEFMADNQTIVTDDAGAYEDWIELYNNTPYTISTKGLYLSDTEAQLTMWAMPERTISAGGYLIIWADGDTLEGRRHANFKLSANGEQVILAYANLTVVDSFNYPPQNPDIAMARYPNGTGNFTPRTPTFNANNGYVNINLVQVTNSFKIYPNPANKLLYLEIEDAKEDSQIELLDIHGRTIFTQNLEAYNRFYSTDISDYPQGVYLLRLTQGKSTETRKFIIQK